MQSISGLISHLNKIDEDFLNIISKLVLDNKGYILRMLKLRIYQKGLDADLNLIGYYAPETIERKREKGQRTLFVNLRDTGFFMDSLTLSMSENNLIIQTTDKKWLKIKERYPDANILALTREELEIVVDYYIDPYFDKILNNNGQIDLFDF